MKRRYCYYLLSLLSVLIVVMATSTCQSIIDNAPLIFLKTAEGAAAERDIVLSPSYTYGQPDYYITENFLNFSRVKDILSPDYNNWMTPRSELTNKIVSAPNMKLGCAQFSTYSVDDFRNNPNLLQQFNQANCKHYTMTFRLIDSTLEKNIGLGRDYPFGAMGQGECIIHTKLAQDLGVIKGDMVLVDLDLNTTLYTIVEGFIKNGGGTVNLTALQFARFKVPLIVRDIMSDSYGKYPDGSVETTILSEYKYFFKHISGFCYNFDDSTSKIMPYLALIDPYNYVPQIVINAPNRISLYLDTNYDKIQQTITKMGSLISERLGIYPFMMDLPVLEELFPLRFSAMFLGVILNMILFILFLLSVILLYSLLLVSVETKTFDLGVVRVLGLNKIGVIIMILLQSLSYVIPGIIIGLILSLPALAYAGNELNTAIGVQIPIYPTPYAAGFAVLLGLLIPLVSSYVPIREALKQNLQTSLDMSHSKTSAVKISIDVEGKGFPWGRISFSLIASGFGISIYYLLPLSLLSLNLGLLIGILFWILLGLLLGLVILSLNVQHLMERLIVFMIFDVALRWFVKAGVRKLILKNLAAHRIRNRRTGIMYALSLAFVIFLIVAYEVQIQSTSYSIRQQHGVYLEVTGDYIDPLKYETFINANLLDHIDSYSWVTDDLASYLMNQGFKAIYLTHIGQIFQFNPQIYGVSPNIFSTTFDEFLDINQKSDSELGIIEQLYTARGSQSMIIGSAYASKLRAGLNKDDSLYLVLFNGTYTKKHELRVSSILNTAPAFKFSNLPSVATQAVLVSLPLYQQMLDSTLSYYDLPMSNLKLKIKGGFDTNHISAVYNSLTNFMTQTGDTQLSLWDFRDFQSSIQKSENVINIIFVIVTIIVMFLCFFSLVSSMSANILEQCKEISVLRSIGVTIRQMISLYIYEAFVLVFASSFTGLCIGTIVGFTMSIQRALFTQLPIQFTFPLSSFLIILVVSVAVAILSTLLPSLRIMKREISVIMKM